MSIYILIASLFLVSVFRHFFTSLVLTGERGWPEKFNTCSVLSSMCWGAGYVYPVLLIAKPLAGEARQKN